jgi:hypothetical protein
MPQDNLQSLIGQFGIDTRSQQEILAERAQKNMDEAMSGEYQERYPGDAGLQRAGAALGTALKNKFNNKLTEEEERHQTAASDARAAVALQVDDGMYQDAEGKLDPVQRAEALEKELAKSLVRQNDQKGIGMLVAIGKRERAKAKDDQEAIAADLSIDAARRKAKKDEYDFGRRIVDEMATIWPKDSLDENDAVDLYIDAEGNARNPANQDIVYRAGEWTKRPPISPEVATAAINGELTERQKALLPSDKERSQFHRRERDVMTQMELGIRLTDAMKEAVNPDGSLTIMGGGGKISAGAINLFDNMMAVGRGLGDSLILTDDADTQTGSMSSNPASAHKWVKDHPGIFASIPLPAGLDRTDQIAVAKYNAILVQYAYGKARLNEENGRISDVDFEHAVTQIAAAATNPEALRQVLIGDVGGSVTEFNNWADQIPPSVYDLVRTPKSQENFEETHSRWQEAFKNPFGSATEVGSGLLPTTPAGTEMSVNEYLNGGVNMDDNALLDSFIPQTAPKEGEL